KSMYKTLEGRRRASCGMHENFAECFIMASAWYIARDGKQRGPFTSEQLQQFAAANRLQPTDKVWKEGMSEWLHAIRIKGLFKKSAVSAKPGAPAAASLQDFQNLDDDGPKHPAQVTSVSPESSFECTIPYLGHLTIAEAIGRLGHMNPERR